MHKCFCFCTVLFTCVHLYMHSTVALTTDASCIMVGTVVNLTCAVNGTPPLDIHLENEKMTILNDSAYTEVEEINPVKIFSVEVLEPGPRRFACVVTNSTGYQEKSPFVNISGLGQSTSTINACVCLSLTKPVMFCTGHCFVQDIVLYRTLFEWV